MKKYRILSLFFVTMIYASQLYSMGGWGWPWGTKQEGAETKKEVTIEEFNAACKKVIAGINSINDDIKQIVFADKKGESNGLENIKTAIANDLNTITDFVNDQNNPQILFSADAQVRKVLKFVDELRNRLSKIDEFGNSSFETLRKNFALNFAKKGVQGKDVCDPYNVYLIINTALEASDETEFLKNLKNANREKSVASAREGTNDSWEQINKKLKNQNLLKILNEDTIRQIGYAVISNRYAKMLYDAYLQRALGLGEDSLGNLKKIYEKNNETFFEPLSKWVEAQKMTLADLKSTLNTKLKPYYKPEQEKQ